MVHRDLALRRVLYVRPPCLPHACVADPGCRYRRLRLLFAASQHWATFDPFQTQKLSAFRSSATGIMTLAESIQVLVKRGKPEEEELHAVRSRGRLGFQLKLALVCRSGRA